MTISRPSDNSVLTEQTGRRKPRVVDVCDHNCRCPLLAMPFIFGGYDSKSEEFLPFGREIMGVVNDVVVPVADERIILCRRWGLISIYYLLFGP